MRVVLVGTGTEVGKTHVACALLRRWVARGAGAVGLKPIETGVSVRSEGGTQVAPAVSDQVRLLRAAEPFHVKHRPRRDRHAPRHHPIWATQSSLFAYPEPVSPHLAARAAGQRIDLTAIDHWVTENAAPVTIVETAGGLFSPLGNSATNLDLAFALRPTAVILVAPDRLGVLHDVTAALGLAAARRRVIDAVVLSAPAVPDASTGLNASELLALSIAQPLAIFPRAPERDPASLAAADQVIDWVERHRRTT